MAQSLDRAQTRRPIAPLMFSMAAASMNRLRLTPSNSSLFQNTPKSSGRNKTYEPCLSLKRVVGTTCSSPVGFDSAGRNIAYVAGGSVVVVDVPRGDEECTQRFYRARPAAAPVFPVPPIPQSINNSSNNNNSATPRANDGRRVAKSSRDSPYGSPDYGSTSSSSTWTSRERIKAATCVSLSKDGRFLAVGETGYAPRVLIFSLGDSSSDRPLVSISEHGFGVRAVAWSHDGRYLASLGTANDGFLFVWKIDPRNGAARLFQQNRCTSYVAGIIWMGCSLITFGTRHVKSWKVVDEAQRPPSPSKRGVGSDLPALNANKTLPGRNVLLGSLLEATFTCALPLDESHAILCSDGGDVCLLDDTTGQMRLTRVAVFNFAINCCTQRASSVLLAGKDGQLVTLEVEDLVRCDSQPIASCESSSDVLVAMGSAQDRLVTVGAGRTIDIWEADTTPSIDFPPHTQLPGQSDAVLGVQSLSRAGICFFTWSASGSVLLWDINGRVRESFEIAVDEAYTGNEVEPTNQLSVVKADEKGSIFAAGDRVGILRIVDHSTGEALLETKAHTSEITHIAVYHAEAKAFVATSGRDRTVQIYHRTRDAAFALLQTLEFPARVTDLILTSDEKLITCSMDRNIQIHELVSKQGDSDAIAAIQCRSIALKATPASMAFDAGSKSLFVSSLDRCVHHFKTDSGQALMTFKTTDENSSDTAVLDSLVLGSSEGDEPPFLLGLSNTDKSVRVYDASTGAFMGREWGHTESITGVALVEDEDERRVVSVGCDGTIMIWTLDFRDSASGTTSRSPSPAKDSVSKPPMRRVLSKAEIAEFQRPSSSHSARRSSPPPLKPLRTRKSRTNMSSSPAPVPSRTPTNLSFQLSNSSSTSINKTTTSPSSSRGTDTPTRRASSNRSGSPAADISPVVARLSRRPSMPALGTTPTAHAHTLRKKSSTASLRSAHGIPSSSSSSSSLQAATEQTCRQLRSYRARLASSTLSEHEQLAPSTLAELEAELRLTAAAAADQHFRHRGRGQQQQQDEIVTEPMLADLLDRYSERLVGMLDERLRMRLEGSSPRAPDQEQERPRTSYSTVSSMDS